MAISARRLVAAVGGSLLLWAGAAFGDHDRSYVGPYDPSYREHPYVAPGVGYNYPSYSNSGRYYRDSKGRLRDRVQDSAKDQRDWKLNGGVEQRAQGDIERGTGKDYDYTKDVGQNSGG